MRPVLSAFTLLLTGAALACLFPGEPLSDFDLTLAVDKTDVPLAVGDGLVVTLKVTNTTGSPRRLPVCQPLGISITDEAGQPMHIEERFAPLGGGCGAPQQEAAVVQDTVLQPGASVTAVVRLGFLPYRAREGWITWEPGTYALRGYLSAFGEQRETEPIAIRLYCPPERTRC